jgi:hypothetical protein
MRGKKMLVITQEKQLLEEVKKHPKLVVIHGTASIARTMIRYFKKNEIEVSDVATKKNNPNTLFGMTIKPLSELVDDAEETVLVVCSTPDKYEIYEELAKELGFPHVIAIDYDLYVSLSVAENIHLDFLCAGFSKSGTTSLQTIFKKHKAVCVPINKESYYLSWRNKYDNAPEKFATRYFPNVKEGDIVGNIEPSYHSKARAAYECFGPDLKIVLMMRNPIDATYSNFKMLMKNPKEKQQAMYFRKHNKFHPSMFDDYMRDYIFSQKDRRYQYSEYVKQWIELFGKEQVKLILFEEIIHDTNRVLDDLQDFIGVPEEKKQKYDKLPKSNAGKYVSKNFAGAMINYRLYKKKLDMKAASVKQMDRYWKVAHFLQKHTYVENGEKITPESRQALKEFYQASVDELSEIAGRDLGEVWKDFAK